MAWHRVGDKPLSEAMHFIVHLLNTSVPRLYRIYNISHKTCTPFCLFCVVVATISALATSVHWLHYSDVTMSAIASQITRITSVYSTVCSGADKKNQSTLSLAFVRGIHRWAVNSPHKGPVTWKRFPFHDVTMEWGKAVKLMPWSPPRQIFDPTSHVTRKRIQFCFNGDLPVKPLFADRDSWEIEPIFSPLLLGTRGRPVINKTVLRVLVSHQHLSEREPSFELTLVFLLHVMFLNIIYSFTQH